LSYFVGLVGSSQTTLQPAQDAGRAEKVGGGNWKAGTWTSSTKASAWRLNGEDGGRVSMH